MSIDIVGIASRLLAGCVIGFVAIVIWVLTNRGVSKPSTEVMAPLMDAAIVDAISPSQVRSEPATSLNGNLPHSEKKSEGSVSAVTAAAQLEEPEYSTPYEIMMSRWNQQASRTSSIVMNEHNKILSSEDDPEWARSMEKELFAYVMQMAASDPTIVNSITCRSAGCEMQLTHGGQSQTATRVMLGLRDRFPSLRPVIDKPLSDGDKILQLTYLTRVKKQSE